MFGTVVELRELADRLTVHADLDEVAMVLEALSTVQAKLAPAIAAIDEHKLWDGTGATSMTGWLKDHGMTGGAAHQCAKRATNIAALPVTSAAWTEGKLSVGQVDVISSHLRDQRYTQLFAEHEEGLLPTLMGLTLHNTTLAMKEWRHRADAILDDDDPGSAEPDREQFVSKTLDGRWVTRGGYGPEGDVINTAIRLAMTKDAPGEPKRTPGRRRADAELDIHRFYMDHQDHRPAHRHRPHVNVIVKSDGHGGWEGETVDGDPLDTATTESMVCDSIIHRFVTDDTSVILDYGVGHETVPMALFNAVLIRDRGCRYPGCDRPPRWCDAHHLQHVSDNGPTNPCNVVLLCNRHHHLIHRKHWNAEMSADGTLTVTSPDKTTRTSRPPGTLSPDG
jgi:hypothetical protein